MNLTLFIRKNQNMSLVYDKKFVDDKLATLTGYTQLSMKSDDLLKKLAKTLIDADTEFTDLFNNSEEHSSEDIESIICENAFELFDLDIPSLLYIDSVDSGDGNPCEFLIALLDTEAKTYTLFIVQGTYSSWDSNNYESILPVTLQTVEYYETQA